MKTIFGKEVKREDIEIMAPVGSYESLMAAIQAGDKSKIFEVKNLRCRPCTKIGYDKCPKGHFKCMNNIDTKEVVGYIQSLIE